MVTLLQRLELESKRAQSAGHKVQVRITATVLVIAPTVLAHEAQEEQRMVLGVILNTQLPLCQTDETCSLCSAVVRGKRPFAERGAVHARCVPLWFHEAVKAPGTWRSLGHDEAEPENLHDPRHDID
eukprot:5750836-Amphidinium_carterae.1